MKFIWIMSILVFYNREDSNNVTTILEEKTMWLEVDTRQAV